MLFSNEEINTLLSILNYQNALFIRANVGSEYLTFDEVQLLNTIGIPPDVVDVKMNLFETMFDWGRLSMAIGNIGAKKMSYNNLMKYLQSSSYIPLTELERNALNVAKRQASKDIRGLGNKISQDFQTTLIEIDNLQRANYEKIISDETQKSVGLRESTGQLASRLGHKTGDWSRDFGRISDYVMHQAFDEGRATSLETMHGKNVEVYKDVYESACKYCVSLYTTDGIGSKPKVFKLSELKVNGNNIGRKPNEWKPIVGPTHPWCRCTLVYKDAAYDWDPETKTFNKPKVYERQVERRSRVRIQVGDKVETI